MGCSPEYRRYLAAAGYSPLNQMLICWVGTAYAIRVSRGREMLLMRNRKPQPPQGGDDGIDEITATEIREKFGPGRYLVEIVDAHERGFVDDLYRAIHFGTHLGRRVYEYVVLDVA